MRKILYFILILFISACSQSDIESESNQVEIEHSESTTEKPTRENRDSIWSARFSKASAQLSMFYGNWFSVEYPADFTASPSTPVQKLDNYTFIETDEARFTSPDGTVEFFIFSPQWGGDPIDYLIEKTSEKTIESSEEKAEKDDPFAVSHKWVTFEDKEGKYTRSYHSLKTESTHHVFGVKYADRKMYERYKAAYLAFKKSLEQFAD